MCYAVLVTSFLSGTFVSAGRSGKVLLGLCGLSSPSCSDSSLLLNLMEPRLFEMPSFHPRPFTSGARMQKTLGSIPSTIQLKVLG